MDALHLLARELQNNPPPVQVSVKDPERRRYSGSLDLANQERGGRAARPTKVETERVALPGAIRLKYTRNDPEIL